MDKERRPFQKNVLNHCYQRTIDGGVLFYSYSDYLVWFTIVCTMARRHQVQILAMCPMPDHVHISARANSLPDLSGFMRDYSHIFAGEHNPVCHRKGPLFESPFGSAPKFTDKSVRSNLIYVGNNPVERKLSSKAEDYRWTFLAYAASDYPFSPKLVIRKARWPLQQAVKEVKNQFNTGRHLTYAQLKRLFKPLTALECQQLTDFIIATYNVIDYNAALQYFNSYENMLLAMHSTTGSEYDIKETYVGKSDVHYVSMANTVMKLLKPNDIHDILAYSIEKRLEVFRLLQKHTPALSKQIAKFLHLPYKQGPIDDMWEFEPSNGFH